MFLRPESLHIRRSKGVVIDKLEVIMTWRSGSPYSRAEDSLYSPYEAQGFSKDRKFFRRAEDQGAFHYSPAENQTDLINELRVRKA